MRSPFPARTTGSRWRSRSRGAFRAAFTFVVAAGMLTATAYGAAGPPDPGPISWKNAQPASVQVPAWEPGPGRKAGGNLEMHFWPGHERLAQRLLESALQAPPLPALDPDILNRGDPIRIYLAPDPERFDALTRGRAPDWSAGVAFSNAGVIVLPVYGGNTAPRTLHRTLRHELAHVGLARYLAPASIPRWFDEGYARWAAGEWDLEAAWQLRAAFAFNRAPPLDSLSLAWPRDAAHARVAYLLAASAVGYLVEESGERGLRLFLERWREGGAMEPALRQTYGLTLGQLEHHWRQSVQRRYGWAAFLSHYTLFWVFAATVLVLLFGIRRRRDRERLERLRSDEPPDAPAYWLGEPAPDEVEAGRMAGSRSASPEAMGSEPAAEQAAGPEPGPSRTLLRTPGGSDWLVQWNEPAPSDPSRAGGRGRAWTATHLS